MSFRSHRQSCWRMIEKRLPLGTRGAGPKGLRGFERNRFRSTLKYAANPLRHFLRKCHLPLPRGARQGEAFASLKVFRRIRRHRPPTKAPLGHKGSWPEGPEGIRTPQIPEHSESCSKSPPSFSSKMPPPLPARGAARGGFRISEGLSANSQALPYFNVGADAHIGPLGSSEFAVDFRKNGVFCVGRCGHRPLQAGGKRVLIRRRFP